MLIGSYDSKSILFVNNLYFKFQIMFVGDYYLCGTERAQKIIVRVKSLNIETQEIGFTYTFMYSHMYTTVLKFLAKNKYIIDHPQNLPDFSPCNYFYSLNSKIPLNRYILKNCDHASIIEYCKNRF